MNSINMLFADFPLTLSFIRWGQILIPSIALIMIFLMLIIFPQCWCKQQQRILRKQIKIGSHIRTIHGLQGTVCAIEQNFIIIESSEGRKLEVVAQTITHIDHESP